MQRYLDKSDTIGTIRQASKHPTGKHYLWVLVEGETDYKLYGKLLNGDRTKVEWVPGGVESLLSALTELIKETQRVIGIRDADFLHLNQQSETLPQLFLTDAHDAEMMLLACDAAFAAVVAEYLPARRADYAVLRETLLASLAFLAGLRWVNHCEDLKLNFRAGLADFYDAANLAITDTNRCLDDIARRSSDKERLPSAQEIADKIATVTDYYKLCQGHDAESALSLHINAIKPQNAKAADIGRALRLAYRHEDFAATQLYRQLKDWEIQTGHLLFA